MTAAEIKCPVCDSRCIADKWPARRIKGNKYILWCGDCGYGWQSPIPSPDQIKEYYRKYDPYIIHGEKEKDSLARYRIRILGKLLPEHGRILDIGSGLGHFLNIASSSGWDSIGIEPQASAAEHCTDKYGIETFTSLDDVKKNKLDSFNVISLWDVWEHIHNPLKVLDVCIDMLNPGGILAISIPNASGLPARLFKGNWRYVMGTHLSYFSFQYVKNTLNDRGMLIEHCDHTIKAQSLVQGFSSWLPFKVDTEKLIRIGRKNSSEAGRHEQESVDELNQKIGSLHGLSLEHLRRLVMKANRISLPLPIGDMMDLYFRKSRR